jgi:hypothetical protein
MDVLAVTIEGGGRAARLAPPGGAPGLHASGLAGWYGTPDGKWSLTERQLADGAFGLSPEQVTYSSRTVTVDGYALGRTRAEAVSSLAPLGAMAHRLVSIAVDDGVAETYATGALTAEVGKGVRGGAVTFALTIVCPDPRRYGTTPRRAYLSPGASAGALAWHADAPHGLAWPLSFGDGGAVANVATLRNDGTSTAYPIITASGDMGGLVLTDASTGAQLAWDGHVGAQPVTLDCLSRTASVAGVDASRLLSSRGFPSVPPGGEVTLALSATGSGTVEVEWRDTYI